MTKDQQGIQIGDKYREYGKRLLHVRGLVEDQVVVRYWSKRKQEWEYKCEPVWYFDPKYGFIERAK